jgi:arylsulfatase A-like enzyme
VPLLVFDPRLPRDRRGRVVDALALNVDLAPTFLDWAGVAAPAGYEGRSLTPLVRGETPAGWRQHFLCEHVDLAPTLTWEGVRTTRWLYARYFDQQPTYEFLHDLQRDPDALANLAGDPAAAAALAELRALCDRELAARGGPLPPLEQRGARRSPAQRKGASRNP